MKIEKNNLNPSLKENKDGIERKEIKGMEIVVADDYELMSQYGAEQIFKNIKNKPDLLMCTATGSTPTRAYDLLAAKMEDDSNAFDKLRIIKLDEWGGIPEDDPATCETYLRKHLIEPMKITPDRFTSFKSNPDNPKQEIERIAKKLEQEGDIDICILGMGVNGHLGFNEPTEELKPNAHVAELEETTMKHTMAQEAEHEIKYGLTLGMDDIMRSKKIILMVNGVHKQEPFKRFISEEPSSRFPVSMLSKHPNVTVICDKEAFPEDSQR
jgi:galactosamine-6-phosphate isomerase